MKCISKTTSFTSVTSSRPTLDRQIAIYCICAVCDDETASYVKLFFSVVSSASAAHSKEPIPLATP